MPKEDEIKRFRNPFPTTDIIIEHYDGNKDGIVLITRKNPPYGLAIPGGFAEYNISLEDNAAKEGKEETGLECIIENPEKPLCVKSNPARDPRAHMISITYIAKGYGRIQVGDDAASARLYTIQEIREVVKNNGLAFDHGEILKEYLKFRGHY